MEFAIETLTRPDETQTAAIRQLETACREHDGTHGSILVNGSVNFDPAMECGFLARREGRPAGVLSVFAPERETAEIAALVAPEYRRRGCFGAMLARAARALRARQVTELLFLCDRESDDGFEAAAALGGRLARTEYTLCCRAGEQASAEVGGLRLRRCGPEDAAVAGELAARVFGCPPERASAWARRSIGAPGREQYLVLLTGVPVGLAETAREDGGAGLHGLGLIPEFRGQGLGTRMMALLLGRIFSAGAPKVIWKVDGANAAARRLSLASGFREETVTDYYRLALPEER